MYVAFHASLACSGSVSPCLTFVTRRTMCTKQLINIRKVIMLYAPVSAGKCALDLVCTSHMFDCEAFESLLEKPSVALSSL